MKLMHNGVYWILNYPPLTYTIGWFYWVSLVPFVITTIALLPIVIIVGYACGEPDDNIAS